MAYTKQTWACGDEITAEKLNHMEDGIEGKQDTLTAGENITITNNVISATGGGSSVEVIELSYNQTTGEFSSPVTPTELVSKLESGTPIIVVKQDGFIRSVESITILSLPVGRFVELNSATSTYEKDANDQIKIIADKFKGNLSNDTWNARTTSYLIDVSLN